MSYGKKIRHPSDILKQGDRVDAVILSVKPEERRIALGLKQTLADPWLEVERKFPAGSQVEGPVTKIMNFGAFVANVASRPWELGRNDCDELRPGGGPESSRSRGTMIGLVVSVTGLKKRKWRAGRRCCGSSEKQRKTCFVSSILRPAGTSNMICWRIGFDRGLLPGSGTRQVHISRSVSPSA